MSRRLSTIIAGAAMLIGFDLAREPDRTAHWPVKPKPTETTERAKVKAARKQRRTQK